MDVFVDPEPGKSFGFIPYMDACQVIEDAAGRQVDFGTRDGLHPELRPHIEQDAVLIF